MHVRVHVYVHMCVCVHACVGYLVSEILTGDTGGSALWGAQQKQSLRWEDPWEEL